MISRATKRLGLSTCTTIACLFVATGAYAARTPLHTVPLGSPESTAILEAERAWMLQDPSIGGGAALEPLLIKRNDKYAYLTARVTGASKIQYIDAVLELRSGHWASTGYMAETSRPSGSVKQMCGYGDGVHRDVFRECK